MYTRSTISSLESVLTRNRERSCSNLMSMTSQPLSFCLAENCSTRDSKRRLWWSSLGGGWLKLPSGMPWLSKFAITLPVQSNDPIVTGRSIISVPASSKRKSSIQLWFSSVTSEATWAAKRLRRTWACSESTLSINTLRRSISNSR